jgi:hypothetical protein
MKEGTMPKSIEIEGVRALGLVIGAFMLGLGFGNGNPTVIAAGGAFVILSIIISTNFKDEKPDNPTE